MKLTAIARKTYNAGGFTVRVAADDNYFIKLLDDYFWTEMPRGEKPLFDVKINVSGSRLPVNFKNPRKNVIHYENSIIDTTSRTIYSYCPRISYPEQIGILFRPLSCLMIYLGYYPIHGSLSKKGNDFIGILGPSRCGKSTLSAHLSLNNFSLLCDDCFFIKSQAGNFKIIPFYKKVNVKNIQDKDLWPLDNAHPGHRQPYYVADKFTLIFPRYSTKRKTRLRPIARKEGTLRLLGGNLALETGQPDNRHGKMSMLDCMLKFEKKSDFFELIYNDGEISKACASIRALLGEKS